MEQEHLDRVRIALVVVESERVESQRSLLLRIPTNCSTFERTPMARKRHLTFPPTIHIHDYTIAKCAASDFQSRSRQLFDILTYRNRVVLSRRRALLMRALCRAKI